MTSILVVDDEVALLQALEQVLVAEGYAVRTATSGEAALGALGDGPAPDILLVDQRMGGISGAETCRRAKRLHPDLAVVVMTAYGSLEATVDAMQAGASDFVTKPFHVPALLDLLARIAAARRALSVVPGGDAGAGAEPPSEILGRSASMFEVYKAIGQVARSSATVLIRGESGTGKELIARAIWRHSSRADKPLHAVSCAALAESLLESELFGHERGAFTGAVATRIGRFENASGGTLFLDEVGDLSPTTQVKLLRVLQEKTIERVGRNEPIKVDTRLLAATHRDLEDLVRQGRFREDLYYRLSVVVIRVPPLRDRVEDVPVLAERFLAQARTELAKPELRLSAAALSALQAHAWPGNVRELEHCLHQAAVTCATGVILPENLRLGLPAAAPTPSRAATDRALLLDLVRRTLEARPGSSYHDCIARLEEVLVAEALSMAHGNLVHAARLLGISRPTLRAKIRAYHIPRPGPP